MNLQDIENAVLESYSRTVYCQNQLCLIESKLNELVRSILGGGEQMNMNRLVDITSLVVKWMHHNCNSSINVTFQLIGDERDRQRDLWNNDSLWDLEAWIYILKRQFDKLVDKRLEVPDSPPGYRCDVPGTLEERFIKLAATACAALEELY